MSNPSTPVEETSLASTPETVERTTRPSVNMKALIEDGASILNRRQPNKRSTILDAMRSLSWKQKYDEEEFYCISMYTGMNSVLSPSTSVKSDSTNIELTVKQIANGEMKNIGTGAKVWPAAIVLLKFLEKKYGYDGLKNYNVVELGAGTGILGIAASLLGAKNVYITDTKEILFLAEENLRHVKENIILNSSQSNVQNLDFEIVKNNKRSVVKLQNNDRFIHTDEYNWGASPSFLLDSNCHKLQMILISDCILPKLYPIDPLVDAIDCLMRYGNDQKQEPVINDTKVITYVSYEHRIWKDFDPMTYFENAIKNKGLHIEVVDEEELDAFYQIPGEVLIWKISC